MATQNCYNLQAGLVDLRAEIEEAVRDFSTAYKNAQSVAQEQIKLAAEVRDSIVKAYEPAGARLIDVLDAERTLPRHLSALHFQPCRLLAGGLQIQLGHWKTDYSMTGSSLPHDEQPH